MENVSFCPSRRWLETRASGTLAYSTFVALTMCCELASAVSVSLYWLHSAAWLDAFQPASLQLSAPACSQRWKQFGYNCIRFWVTAWHMLQNIEERNEFCSQSQNDTCCRKHERGELCFESHHDTMKQLHQVYSNSMIQAATELFRHTGV